MRLVITNSFRVLPASHVVYHPMTIETCGLLLKYFKNKEEHNLTKSDAKDETYLYAFVSARKNSDHHIDQKNECRYNEDTVKCLCNVV